MDFWFAVVIYTLCTWFVPLLFKLIEYKSDKNKYYTTISKNGKILSFDIGSEKYSLFIPRGKKQLPITSAHTTENGEVVDVTSDVKQYYGPNNDFFISSTEITPKIMGYDSLTIKSKHDVVSYEGNDTINVDAHKWKQKHSVRPQ